MKTRMRNVIVVGGVLISLALPACASQDEPTIEPGGASPSATATQAVSPSPGEDVSGNCDEPEHKSDATCQAGAGGEDNSGSGGDDSGGGGGSNSGPGY